MLANNATSSDAAAADFDAAAELDDLFREQGGRPGAAALVQIVEPGLAILEELGHELSPEALGVLAPLWGSREGGAPTYIHSRLQRQAETEGSGSGDEEPPVLYVAAQGADAAGVAASTQSPPPAPAEPDVVEVTQLESSVYQAEHRQSCPNEKT